MASESRTCPRCKTDNARSRTNCRQCGAVMLGVAAHDIEELVRLPRSAIAPDLAAIAARSQAPRAASGGCLGCLVKPALVVVIAAALGLMVVVDKARERHPGWSLEDIVEDLAKKAERDLTQKHAPRQSYPRYSPSPAPVVPAFPAPPRSGPTAATPQYLPAAPPNAPALSDREQQARAAIALRMPLVRECLRKDAGGRPLERVTLKVMFQSTGRLITPAVVEPPLPSVAARSCVRSAFKDVQIAPAGAPLILDYTWKADGADD